MTWLEIIDHHTGYTISRFRKEGTMNNTERSAWIDNDEGLYNWFHSSGKSKAVFSKENRQAIDEAIRNVRSGAKPVHYLAYPHNATCLCYHCTHRS